MKVIPQHPEANETIQAWLKAKDAEAQWTEYRRKLEDTLLEMHDPAVQNILGSLRASDSLSTSAQLGPLVLTFKRELKIDQLAATAFLIKNPTIASALLKTELKAANSKALVSCVRSSSPPDGFEDVASLIERKTSFSAKG